MTPRATYRLQFHAGFPFVEGEKLAPYLSELGISHLYCSPILTARAGSPHGYDVIDHATINPELGGENGFRAMAAALRARSIGIILDIVPNHMAAGGARNHWWLDVLEKGRASEFADHFDIDWKPPDERLRGKVLVPFLGAPFGETLVRREIKLVFDEALQKFVFAYHEHRFPLRLEDYPGVMAPAVAGTRAAWRADAGLARINEGPGLAALLARQNFVLAWWQTARDRINWRRFFDISELAGLKVEREAVFDAVHAVPLRLYREGLIDGLRIDHIDGLANPLSYLKKLRECLNTLTGGRPAEAGNGPAYLIVEKILARNEALPSTWPVDGTTGYDFMNDVSALQHAPTGEAVLTKLWRKISGRPRDFEEEERGARKELLETSFEAQLRATAHAFARLADSLEMAHDFSEPLLRRALIDLIAEMRVYRCYAGGDHAQPCPHFDDALARAAANTSADEREALSLIADAVAGRAAGPDDILQADATRRLNQLSAPIAAKAVEDTAFYRYGRLLSRNDVGFDPREFSLPVAMFHARAIARAAAHPCAMLTTATHDHKRGEDTRARLAVVSEMPHAWETAVWEWMTMTAPLGTNDIESGDVYQLLQTLVGAWPLDLGPDERDRLAIFETRIQQWQLKSLREAKLHTAWSRVDENYEAANRRLVAALLDPVRGRDFLASLAAFVGRIAASAAANAIVQTALRYTLPGVPDLYQGTELWDLSLVDPDNRRAVDFDTRVSSLRDPAPIELLAREWRDGRIKQHTVAKLLALRLQEPQLFANDSYRALQVCGANSEHALAFARKWGARAMVVVVARHCAGALAGSERLTPPPEWWADATVELETFANTSVRSALEERALVSLPPQLPLSQCFQLLPVAVFVGS